MPDSHEHYKVVQEGLGPRRYFSMIPHVIWELPLRPRTRELLMWYIRVCGEDGDCWMSTKTIADKLKMDRRTLSAARDQLEEAGLIRTERRRIGDNPRESIAVTITESLWNLNHVLFDPSPNAETHHLQLQLKKMSEEGSSSVEESSSFDTQVWRNVHTGVEKCTLESTKDCIKEKHYKKNTEGQSEVAPQHPDGVNSSPSEDGKFTDQSGFIPEEEKKTSPTNFDMRCAMELNKGVVKNHKTDRKNDLRKWAREFRLLRERDGAAKDGIKAVLQWYLDQDWSDQFLPKAFSGSAFRRKFFDSLLPAYRRAEENGEVYTPPPEERNGHSKKTVQSDLPPSDTEEGKEQRWERAIDAERVGFEVNGESYEEFVQQYEIDVGEQYIPEQYRILVGKTPPEKYRYAVK